MAHKRMFSKDVTGSDAFRDMPTSTQALYFHLGMEADDDGFLGNFKSLMRGVGATDDDLKILISKRFLLQCEEGIIVIKHWLINNTVRRDRYHETKYLKQKKSLITKENGAYTDGLQVGKPLVNHLATEKRIEEDRIEEDSIATQALRIDQGVIDTITNFKEINPSYERLYSNKTQRDAADRLQKKYGSEKVARMVEACQKALGEPYAPKITTPFQLERDLAKLVAWYKSQEKISNKSKAILI